MRDDTVRFLRKFIASGLCAALIAFAPGPEALAQVVGVAVGAGARVVPGGAAGAAVNGLKASGGSINLGALSGGAASLQGALPGTPSFTPALGRSLVPAAVSPAVPGIIGAKGRPAWRGGSPAVPGIIGAKGRPAAVSGIRSAVAPGAEANVRVSVRGAVSKSLSGALRRTRAFGLNASRAAKLGGAGARSAGAEQFDLLIGRTSIKSAGAAPAPVAGRFGRVGTSGLLTPIRSAQAGKSLRDAAPAPARNGVSEQSAPSGVRSTLGGTPISLARVVMGAGAVYGLHTAAMFLLPSAFGAAPVAAVWAVSSGVLLLPVALYSRYRLAKRDSARLRGVKALLDLTIGGFLGAVAAAVPGVLSGAILTDMTLAIPLLAGVSAAAALSAARGEGSGGIINGILAWMSLNLLHPLIGSVAASPLALGGIFGLLALPAMTTVSFFLGRIISSAESGQPFAVPGSMRQIRFPSYTWVLTGVVFALLTGYTPVWTNAAFALWMFLGKTRLFNYLYGGIVAWSVFTGFGAPVAFLAIAFAPERAAMLTEFLLGKILKRGPPAPSTQSAPVEIKEEAPERWPRFNYWLKTGAAIGGLAALGGVMSATVFGPGSFLINLGVAGALSLVPFLFAKKIIKIVMKARPMNEAEDPEVYGIMRELRERINADLSARGKKEIPMPEMVNVPMPVPNAFATGRSPYSAMVGVTNEMKAMTLNPERTRAGLIRMLHEVEPQSKSFLVYRKAIRGSLPEIAETAGPLEIIQAIEKAEPSQIKALGVRALRGVMGHEFSHVMHRDMLLGVVTGTISSGIAFASYGVLWAVGHAQALMARLWEKITGRGGVKSTPMSPQGVSRKGTGEAGPSEERFLPERYKTQVFEPVTTGVAAQSLLSLVKIFAALWGPILATILQMASSRTREGHADEAGGILTDDPEALAIGLGLLTSWRPPSGFVVNRALLPIIASQAHVMTVNPIEQLHEAGALPKLGAVTRMAVGKEDNFFFNLFITHPDTKQRIERLHEMSIAPKK